MVFYFLANQLFKEKIDANVIYNIATHYAREYGLMDRLDHLKELIKNYGNEPFYIFRYISLVKNFQKIQCLQLKFPVEGNTIF